MSLLNSWRVGPMISFEAVHWSWPGKFSYFKNISTFIHLYPPPSASVSIQGWFTKSTSENLPAAVISDRTQVKETRPNLEGFGRRHVNSTDPRAVQPFGPTPPPRHHFLVWDGIEPLNTWGFLSIWGPKEDGLLEQSNPEWMIWGYHHFRKLHMGKHEIWIKCDHVIQLDTLWDMRQQYDLGSSTNDEFAPNMWGQWWEAS